MNKFITPHFLSRLPSFLGNDYALNSSGNLSKFGEFLKLYYTFLEQEPKAKISDFKGFSIASNSSKKIRDLVPHTGNLYYQLTRINDLFDIDETPLPLIEQLRFKYLPTIPYDTVLEQRKFIKFIKKLYQSKGTLESFRYFFRTVFGVEIFVSEAKDYLLKPSIGETVKSQAIRVFEATENFKFADFDTLKGLVVRGLESGASAVINNTAQFLQQGSDINELILESDTLKGTFSTTSEELEITDYIGTPKYMSDGITPIRLNSKQSLVGVNITEPGNGYAVGDNVELKKSNGDVKIVYKIKKVGKGSLDGVTVTAGGAGYASTDKLKIYNSYLKVDYFEKESITAVNMVGKIIEGVNSNARGKIVANPASNANKYWIDYLDKTKFDKKEDFKILNTPITSGSLTVGSLYRIGNIFKGSITTLGISSFTLDANSLTKDNIAANVTKTANGTVTIADTGHGGPIVTLSSTTPTPSGDWQGTQTDVPAEFVSTTSTSGTGATFTITTNSAGTEVTVTLDGAGTGYEIGDGIVLRDPGTTTNTVTIGIAMVGGVWGRAPAGTGGSVTITVDPDGNDFILTVAADGTGYANLAQFTLVDSQLEDVCDADGGTLTIRIGVQLSKYSSGSGYTSAGSAVAVTGGSGTGLTVSYSQLSGSVDTLTDTTPTPTGNFGGGQIDVAAEFVSTTSTNGAGATFTISTNSTGNTVVVKIVEAGTGYEIGDDIVLRDPGATTHTVTIDIATISSGVDAITAINAAGEGYVAGDYFTIPGGTANSLATFTINESATDDFINVGATENKKEHEFVAIGATPTSWGGGSNLIELNLGRLTNSVDVCEVSAVPEITLTTGVVTDVSLIHGGVNYSELPYLEMLGSPSSAATFTPFGYSVGSVLEIDINTFDIIESTDTLTFGSKTTPNVLALASPVLGTIISYEISNLNIKGRLSSFDKVIDNFTFTANPFTYEIKTELNTSKWEEPVKLNLHPAGFKLIANYNILNTSSSVSSIAYENV